MENDKSAWRGLAHNLVLIGAALSSAFWLLEAALHSYVFDSGSLLSNIIPADPNEFWMRIFVAALILSFSVYSHHIISRLKRAEEAIAGSERKYREIIETSDEGIWMIDAGLRTTFVNRRLSEMLGYAASEMLGAHPFSFMDMEARAEAEKWLAEVRRGERGQKDFRFRRKDSTDLWTILSSSPILDERGEFAGALAMLNDITERKRAEDALRESRELYSTLAETAQDFIFIVTREMRIQYMNSYAARHMGLTQLDAVGKRIEEFFPEQGGKFKSDIRKVFDSGAALSGLEDRVSIGGADLWLDTSLTPLKSKNGEVKAVIINSVMGISRDITSRKVSELELRDEKEKAETYFELASVVFLILGRDRKVVRMNRKGLALLGVSEEEAVGRDWFESFVPEKDRAGSVRCFDGVISGEAACEYNENPVAARDGSERLIAWRNTVLFDKAGSVTGILSSGEDITEKRKADESLKARLDELERFRKATVEREFRIKELRDRIAELEEALSRRAS